MKILGLSYNILWKQKNENFSTIEQLLNGAQADLFVLPEMFSTGFCMDAEEIADQNGESLVFLKKMAFKKNAAFCGSAAIKEEGRYYNRMYFVLPDGTFQQYDKRHLFTYSGEDKVYERGNEKVIVEYKNIRFLLQICYDLRFPVFSRNENSYDVALYVANWPVKREEAWQHLLKARAIENMAYVFGVNRVGSDGNHLHYKESSYCFFGDGKEIGEKNDPYISVELTIDKLEELRKQYCFLEDRDDFLLQI